ncbi:hypothetical protein [Bythopirellula polymerisocia]|uniref:hypothetical protein n=1 Tax=Bythopirellula polymerisocia TaxID=2528003 RepID=UPI0011B3F2BF|nr:hypothetical protein [Bythopirellula polymerisocia]
MLELTSGYLHHCLHTILYLLEFVASIDSMKTLLQRWLEWPLDKVAGAWGGTASKVARMRTQQIAGETVLHKFIAEEREKML